MTAAPARSCRGQPRRHGRLRVALTVAAGALVLTALAVLVARPANLIPGLEGHMRVITFVGGSWLVYGLGAWLLHRLPMRAAVLLIVAGGIALPLAAGLAGADQPGTFGPPRGSDDLYRYVWDGRVQAAGIDPYRYVPAAPELVDLRDDFLWPERSNWCIAPGDVDPEGSPLVPGCSLINRPSVHTIYPPVAEALFLVVHWLAPPGSRHGPVQLTMAAVAVATTLLLLVGLRSTGADPRRAVLWAWCPLVVVEAGSSAHVDVVAAFLTGLAVLVLARARTRAASGLGGVLFGLAVATKLTPALVAPALVRRRPIIVAAAAGSAVAVVYLPHVLAVGPGVIGYIPGYLTEEGHTDGSRFALLTLLAPRSWAGPLAVAILLAVAVWVAHTTDPNRPWIGATTMTGAVLLVATPSYGWYAMLLVLLVALGGQPAWLGVALAGQLAQYANDLDIDGGLAMKVGYGIALTVLIIGMLRRPRVNESGTDTATVTGPSSAEANTGTEPSG